MNSNANGHLRLVFVNPVFADDVEVITPSTRTLARRLLMLKFLEAEHAYHDYRSTDHERGAALADMLRISKLIDEC